jgi:hypothetical protein
VVEVIAGRRRDPVVAARHEHGVAVADRQRLVQLAVRGVDPLEGETLGGANAVEVGLLQRGLLGQRLAVVLVRGIARPMPGRGEDLSTRPARDDEAELVPIFDHEGGVSAALSISGVKPAILGRDPRSATATATACGPAPSPARPRSRPRSATAPTARARAEPGPAILRS